MKGGDLMKNLWWLGQFGPLKTSLDRDDEGMVVNDDDECYNNNDEEYDGDYLVQQRSGCNDLIGGGSKEPRKHQRNDASSYKFEEERNI